MSSQDLFVRVNKTSKIPNITSLIYNAVELVEKNSTLTGRQKKEYCMSIILDTINLLPDDNNKKLLMENYNTGNISELIDLVIDVSKGKININKKINLILKCVLSCFNNKTIPK